MGARREMSIVCGGGMGVRKVEGGGSGVVGEGGKGGRGEGGGGGGRRARRRKEEGGGCSHVVCNRCMRLAT